MHGATRETVFSKGEIPRIRTPSFILAFILRLISEIDHRCLADCARQESILIRLQNTYVKNGPEYQETERALSTALNVVKDRVRSPPLFAEGVILIAGLPAQLFTR